MRVETLRRVAVIHLSSSSSSSFCRITQNSCWAEPWTPSVMFVPFLRCFTLYRPLAAFGHTLVCDTPHARTWISAQMPHCAVLNGNKKPFYKIERKTICCSFIGEQVSIYMQMYFALHVSARRRSNGNNNCTKYTILQCVGGRQSAYS